jgi:hypothetical protein
MNDLQSATIGELIEELTDRQSFQGIVMFRSDDDPRLRAQEQIEWQWKARNCHPRLVVKNMMPLLPRIEQQ